MFLACAITLRYYLGVRVCRLAHFCDLPDSRCLELGQKLLSLRMMCCCVCMCVCVCVRARARACVRMFGSETLQAHACVVSPSAGQVSQCNTYARSSLDSLNGGTRTERYCEADTEYLLIGLCYLEDA